MREFSVLRDNPLIGHRPRFGKRENSGRKTGAGGVIGAIVSGPFDALVFLQVLIDARYCRTTSEFPYFK